MNGLKKGPDAVSKHPMASLPSVEVGNYLIAQDRERIAWHDKTCESERDSAHKKERTAEVHPAHPALFFRGVTYKTDTH